MEKITAAQKRAREREWILEEIRSKIGTGAMAPGQRLIELQLCAQFGVKRSRIREVLKQLEQDGLVRIVPHAGAVVAELSQKDIEQAFDVLGVLQGLAARVATASLTPQDVDRLEAIVLGMEQTVDPSLCFEHNAAFHNLITALSENEVIARVTANLVLHLRRCGLAYYMDNQLPVGAAEHRKIFEAMKEGDSIKVEQLVRDHFLHGKYRLIKRLNKSL